MTSLRDAGGLLAGVFAQSKGPEYHKIGWEGSDEPEYGGRQLPLRRSLGRCLPCGLGRWSLKTVIATAGSLIILMLLALAGSHTSAPSPPAADDRDPHNRRLRIIVPADEPGANLCKMLLSTVANGYPAPLVINWGRDFHKKGGWFGGSHLGKIDGTLDALEALASDEAPPAERLRPDDLVLVVDAYDVWFQLPPSVLIERYLAQNAAADARVRADWSLSAPDAVPAPTQRIIISTQKKCWPRARDGHETHCDVLPESTAREDLYGPDTDKGDPTRDGRALHRTRPRYINSGAILGRADDVLHMFRRGLDKVHEGQAAGKNIFSDQGVLGEILGQQEVWRKQQRERHAAALAGQPFDETAYPADVSAGGAETWEFGIGLDYLQDLFVPTVFEEDDGEYLMLKNDARVNASSEDRGISPSRITMPSDMDGLAPPLTHANVVNAENEEELSRWENVPLYADYYSGRIPVGVHHNAHRGGMKGVRLRFWWGKTWFHPFLRDIVAAREVRPRQLAPLAVIKAASSWARDVVYWPPASDADRPRPRIFDRETLGQGLDEAEWHTLCRKEGERPWWDIIFDDGRGPEGLGPKDAVKPSEPEVKVKKPDEKKQDGRKPDEKGSDEKTESDAKAAEPAEKSPTTKGRARKSPQAKLS
ncbi:hypothetical protein ACHAQH_005547 [Verticillium albo-atrum]